MKEFIWGRDRAEDLFIYYTTYKDTVGIEGYDIYLAPYAYRVEEEYARFYRDLGYISDTEYEEIINTLNSLRSGKIDLRNYEDIHSLIEDTLVKKVGKSPYICRSRNDTICAVERLYLKDFYLNLLRNIEEMGNSIYENIEATKDIPSPLHTHYRVADIGPLSLYFISYLEELTHIVRKLEPRMRLVNTSPLGASAIGGCPLNINFRILSNHLGFKYIHQNPLEAINSRKRHIAEAIETVTDVYRLLSRMAKDLIRLSGNEYGIIRLPRSYTTGSSVLIHKENPDLLEIIIGRHIKSVGYLSSINSISGDESGYQRWIQEYKGLMIELCIDVLMALKLMTGLLKNIEYVKGVSIREVKLTWLATLISWSTKENYRKIYNEIKEMGLKALENPRQASRKLGVNYKKYVEALKTVNHMDFPSVYGEEYINYLYTDFKDIIVRIRESLT